MVPSPKTWNSQSDLDRMLILLRSTGVWTRMEKRAAELSAKQLGEEFLPNISLMVHREFPEKTRGCQHALAQDVFSAFVAKAYI